MRPPGRAAALLAVLLVSPLTAGAQAPSFDAVAKIFNARCVLCHSGDNAPRGLRLDSHAAVLAGSQGGAVAKAGDPAGSELVRRIRGTSTPRMPMTGPPYLSADEVATIEAWIAAGMPAGTSNTPPAPAAARPVPGETITYSHVAPILATRCAKCHTDNGLMGPPPEGLRLTSYAATLAAAERARVIPGQPLASELLRRLRGQSRPRMPFDGPPWLDGEEIALIERWIRQGARDAGGKPAPMPVGARVRFEGTLTGPAQIDGLDLRLTERSRIDKKPRTGDRVELRGRVAADGGIEVRRLRRR